MLLLFLLLIWCAVSVPLGMLSGRLLRQRAQEAR